MMLNSDKDVLFQALSLTHCGILHVTVSLATLGMPVYRM